MSTSLDGGKAVDGFQQIIANVKRVFLSVVGSCEEHCGQSLELSSCIVRSSVRLRKRLADEDVSQRRIEKINLANSKSCGSFHGSDMAIDFDTAAK